MGFWRCVVIHPFDLNAVQVGILWCVVHAAVIAINDAIEHRKAPATLSALKNPAAHLSSIVDGLMDAYQDVLLDAKSAKAEIARNRVCL